MTHFEKVLNSLVTEGNQRTAAQLAAQLGTTTNAVRARISEIRDKGYVIEAQKHTDTKGRVKTFYRQGKPSLDIVAAGRMFLKLYA